MAYATAAGMGLIFGDENLNSWSDLDNDGDAATITARKAQAVLVADAAIEDVARLTGYKIPLVTAAGATPVTVADQANRLAGLYLYEGRGALESNQRTGDPYHRYVFVAIRVRRWLEQLRNNEIKLDAVMGG